MALIHNNILGIYAGVSKQAVDMRLPNHCEEMVNCYPTVQNGLQRRNPTRLISSDITVEESQFKYSYDRGLSGETSEQYLVTIDDINKLRVFDILSNTYRDVVYDGSSLAYLSSSNYRYGFSAMTIKDNTFIANRDIVPKMIGSTDITTTVTSSNATISFGSGYTKTVYIGTNSKITFLKSTLKTLTNLSPARIKDYVFSDDDTLHMISSLGATYTITIDGEEYNYTVSVKTYNGNIVPETVDETRANVYNLISSNLLDTVYSISINSSNELFIEKKDGTAIEVTSTIGFPALVSTAPTYNDFYQYSRGKTWNDLGDLVFNAETNEGVGGIGVVIGEDSSTTLVDADYNKVAHVWIKQVSVDTAFPYTFSITLKETSGSTISTTTSNATTSNGVATAFASWANGLADFTATASGSIVRITRDSGTDYDIVISDTYGDQASVSFKGVVTTMSDLPKTFPHRDTIIKVDGVDRTDDTQYWVKYDGSSWIEWRDPSVPNKIDASTMPHILVRNADFTFTFKQATWDDMNVGDYDSQSLPDFIGSNIMDMFFVNGRFGILSKNGISLTQINNLFNFFRTTILQLLDDSAITTQIDSGRVVGLKFATELQNKVILFGDKMQFAIDASKAITPSTIVVQPISGFEINQYIKPVSVGDSIFFVVNRGTYSSLLEMNLDTISSSVKAIDVSSHVNGYIDSTIVDITYSQRDNCIFILGDRDRDIIYVYKYFNDGAKNEQMAWSKWQFSSIVVSIFSFDKSLYLVSKRYDTEVPIGEFSLVKNWVDGKLWNDTTKWVDADMATYPTFERIDIEPYALMYSFYDNETIEYNSTVELSDWYITDNSSIKETRGSLMLKTIEISSENGSDFSLRIKNTERNAERTIPSLYTVDRKPYISGTNKNTKMYIESVADNGFQIKSISLEGQYNVRSKRV